ncbi:HTH domain-containing protein [Campylobacter upsaliensis]|uniref:HTH domain-containing protein n=1 Tax=Campylobacter upsaliensis TaxID=28080 RepID=UPI001845476B|nr:HTH domain-containing protein [Campylobacter upsaliensis]EAH5199448.1 HrgA protein [Campylobacter upsaliensis]EAJ4972467.1 HrgA protein [Campylobacter upsaliensis]EAJ7017832.1 HrgA protein [Campylobacter upsaliensis]MCR2088436.1 HTH domain-containing protein [Campylobacter upsaliensis]MCR2097465.1 HTH domain-containing protein [Campylobacter upsaliensis]
MSKITYKELIVEVLKEAKKPLSVSEIWEKACEMGLEKRLSSIGQTPTQTLWNRFFVNRDDFIKATQKPITFWLRSRQNELINLNLSEEKEVRLEKTKFNERDLHPLLVKFLYENLDFRLNSKTIYHEKSKKSENGKDKWNYPDIVGVYFPYDDYQNETLGLLESLKLNNYKIFSFELKININFSNLKESYFQAVSNSSWANEGYLVVLKELDSEVLSELRRLNQSFGIGVIQLDGSEISNSKIVLSAKEKALDMQTIDMLVDKNEDFKKFINDINQQIRAGKDAKIQAEFDRVKSDEEMAKYLKEKHILEG